MIGDLYQVRFYSGEWRVWNTRTGKNVGRTSSEAGARIMRRKMQQTHELERVRLLDHLFDRLLGMHHPTQSGKNCAECKRRYPCPTSVEIGSTRS